jgi:peptide/nickel transport system substrate-binding protein
MGFTPQALSYPRPESLVNQLSPEGTNGKRVRWDVTRVGADQALAAIAAVTAAADETTRESALQDWQRVMLEVSPFLPLAQNSGTIVSTPAVSEAEYTAAGWLLDLERVAPA